MTKKSIFQYNFFEVLVLNITLSSVNDKCSLRFVVPTVYRPPGHHTDFIKEFADFLSELVLAADKVLFVGDFNIHADNEKDDKYVRPITSATKDCFINNLPDQLHHFSIPDSLEELDSEPGRKLN